MKINKILVANRGEIALRIMRSAKEMGIKTIAVYSEADRGALHTRYADEAVLLGPAPSALSYLRGEKIIEEALRLGADAIHPGYGFLSENAEFAKLVEASGLIFIGPSWKSMEMMGNKLAAKSAVEKHNIPMVPGTPGAITDKKLAKEIALEIGLPVLIKAAAGGGGKGMKLVEDIDTLDEMIDLAISEAQKSFGDGAVFIEKFVTKPRHIEIQVFGDQHGNVVHLFERECSIQRRHQKLIEEAPSAILTPEVREKMGEVAVRVAKACGYYNAGTVEFLLDNQMNFYFLEMNTRLQVEHPVSELITGLDFVKEQIRVAEGEPLSFKQEDLKILGHSIELRICAEDPAENFVPDIGRLNTYKRPQGLGVRVDDGFEEGMEIPIHYDPMIAKLIVHGRDRNDAINRMVRAIEEYQISGVKTTLPFGKFAMQNEHFISGDFDTNFIKAHFTPNMLSEQKVEEMEVAAVIANLFSQKSTPKANEKSTQNEFSSWRINRTRF